jgi:hypothetical protein
MINKNALNEYQDASMMIKGSAVLVNPPLLLATANASFMDAMLPAMMVASNVPIPLL